MFQGSALTQFYLLEDVSHGASAVPGTLQCIRSLLEQHDSARFGFCWAAVLLQGASAVSGMVKTGERETLHKARSLAMLQSWPRRRAGGTGQQSAEGLSRVAVGSMLVVSLDTGAQPATDPVMLCSRGRH